MHKDQNPHPRRTTVAISAILAIILTAGVATAATAGASAPKNQPVARAAQACGGDRAPRNPANPLDLPQAPGQNPLNGARLFVPGPAHGSAAGAIASMMGRRPSSYSSRYTWLRFDASLSRGGFHRRLLKHRGLAHNVRELAKIAAEPEAQRFSRYAWGGTPGGTLRQVNKIFCQNLAADPGSIPLINTYYAHPLGGDCSSGALQRNTGLFHRFIDAVAAGTGNHRAVFLLELDALGSSTCYARAGSLGIWDGWLRYEVDELGRLPHTVVYVEGGYSDSNGPGYTARQLRAIDRDHVPGFRGFFTNDTHENWTISEVRWAEKISRQTGGLHYVVNTSDNGHGPKPNRNKVKYGNNDLCNPPGRGLGPRDTTLTGFAHADAFLWTHPPGNTSGHCRGGAPSSGGPPNGSFWPARAIYLADRANSRLGPGYPSLPY